MKIKQLSRTALAAALWLGAAVGAAHAQFTTTGAYVPTGTDNSSRTAIQAGGNSETLTVFQAAITSAFANGTGGDITFDNTSLAGTALATSVTATYGTLQGSTLIITQNAPITAAGGGGNYSTGVDAANATSGSNYFGYSNVPVAATTYNFDFNFSQGLSDFGVMVINRGQPRALTFTVTLSDGSVVTPNASPVATSNGNLNFFEYAPTGPLTISAVNFATNGYTRFDDLGFVSPIAAPEPSSPAAFAVGLLGLGLLGLRARKRSLTA